MRVEVFDHEIDRLRVRVLDQAFRLQHQRQVGRFAPERFENVESERPRGAGVLKREALEHERFRTLSKVRTEELVRPPGGLLAKPRRELELQHGFRKKRPEPSRRDERGGFEAFRTQEPRRGIRRKHPIEGVSPDPITRQVPVAERVHADVFEDVREEKREAFQIANGPEVRVKHVIALVDAGAPRVDHPQRIREVDPTESDHFPVRGGDRSVETNLDPVVAAKHPKADARHALGKRRVSVEEVAVEKRTNLLEDVRNRRKTFERLLRELHLFAKLFARNRALFGKRHPRILRGRAVRLETSRPQSGERLFHFERERVGPFVGIDRFRSSCDEVVRAKGRRNEERQGGGRRRSPRGFRRCRRKDDLFRSPEALHRQGAFGGFPPCALLLGPLFGIASIPVLRALFLLVTGFAEGEVVAGNERHFGRVLRMPENPLGVGSFGDDAPRKFEGVLPYDLGVATRSGVALGRGRSGRSFRFRPLCLESAFFFPGFVGFVFSTEADRRSGRRRVVRMCR